MVIDRRQGLISGPPYEDRKLIIITHSGGENECLTALSSWGGKAKPGRETAQCQGGVGLWGHSPRQPPQRVLMLCFQESSPLPMISPPSPLASLILRVSKAKRSKE